MPWTLAYVQGDNQVGPVNTVLPLALVVSVKDANGSAVVGATVDFNVVSVSYGTLSATHVPTDAAGRASVKWTMPSTTGQCFADASLNGGQTIGFVAAAVAGPAARLVFSTGPRGVIVGDAAPTIQVAVQDASGNLVTNPPVPVSVALGVNTTGATLGGTLTVTSANGHADFPDLTIDRFGTSYTLVASSSGLLSATSTPFAASRPYASTLAFVTPPVNTPPGAVIAPAVRVAVVDPYGAVITDATATIQVRLNPPPTAPGVLSGTFTQVAVNGVATFSDLSVDFLGAGYTLTASAPGLWSVDSVPFDITGGPAVAGLAFTSQPADVTTGTTFSTLVAAVDAAGVRVVSAVIPVTLAIGANPGGSTLGGTTATSTFFAGRATFNVSLDKLGTGYTLVASSPGLPSATSASFSVVSPGTPVRATVVAFGTPTTDQSFSVTVFISDGGGNPVSGSIPVTIGFGVNPGGATLVGTTTGSAVNGFATFAVSCHTAMKRCSVTASIPSLPGVPVQPSQLFDILPGAPAAVAFTTQPGDVPVGGTTSARILCTDAYGNAVADSSRASLSLGSNPGGATIDGDLLELTVAGVATFSTVALDKPGAGYTLIASVGTAQGTSAPFNVGGVGVLAQLAFAVQPAAATAGSPMPTFTVQIQDPFGSLVTSATNEVTIQLGPNAGGARASGTLTATAVNGVATFASVVLVNAGAGFTLRALSPGLARATSAPFAVTAGADAGLAFVGGPSNVAPATPFAPAVSVAVVDAFGNRTASSAAVSLAIGTNPGGGTLGGTTTTFAANGLASFGPLSISTPGSSYTLVATSPGLASATSVPFNVSGAGVPARLAFSVQPTNGVARATLPAVQVSVVDVFGNVVGGATNLISVALATNPAGVPLYGTLRKSAGGGSAIYVDLRLQKAAVGYSLIATSPGLTSATSGSFTVAAAPPAAFDLGAPRLVGPRALGAPLAFRSVVAADLDGDGVLDVAAVEPSANVAAYWPGLGDGGFGARVDLALPPTVGQGPQPAAVVAGDLDGDGKTDLVVLYSEGVAVFLQDPAKPGRFLPPLSLALPSTYAGSDGARVTIGDLDADGVPDLVVGVSRRSFSGPNTALIFLQDPAARGTFGAPVTIAAVPATGPTTVADLDGDGRNDILMADGTLILQDPAIAGRFLMPRSVAPGYQSIAVDLDGDGLLDLATVLPTGGSINIRLRVAVRLRDPARPTEFSEPVYHGTSLFPLDGNIASGDLDGDGLPDLLVGTSPVVLLQRSSVPGSFAAAAPVGTVLSFTEAVLADFDGDGRLDLALGRISSAFFPISYPITVSLHAAAPGPTFVGPSLAVPPASLQVSRVAVADLNGDGIPDLAVAIPGVSPGGVEVAVQSSAVPTGQLLGPQLVPSGVVGGTQDLAVADLDGDGALDVVFTDSAGKLWVVRQDPARPGTFLPAASYSVPFTPTIVLLVDVDRDGRLDAVVGGSNGVRLFRQDPANPGAFLAPTTVRAAGSVQSVRVADLNGDGWPDVVVVVQSFNEVDVILQNSASPGTFGSPSIISLTRPTALAVADLDGDGRVDLAIAGYYGLVFLKGSGTGSFAAPTVLFPTIDVADLVAADLNGDGALDLVVVIPNDAVQVLLQDPSKPGVFVAGQGYAADRPAYVVVSDVNRDGRPDLVVSDAKGIEIFFGR